MAQQEDNGINIGDVVKLKSDEQKKKNLVLTEKQVEVVQLALKALINTLDNRDAFVLIAESLTKTLQEYSEEAFASVHSQGG
jgi:hypothetical protein